MNKTRQRPIAEKNNTVGKQRYDRYQKVIARYQEAIKQGFYLEAITLMESLIADRLESVVNYIYNENDDNKYSYNYTTLEILTRYIEKRIKENHYNDDFVKDVEDIYAWKNKRNEALHEIAKLDEKLSKTYEMIYNSAKQTAEEGYRLFRRIDVSKRKIYREDK
ncbi:MAG: hypothetical protein J5606_00255 [Bacteroidales bacterium]|nr:hypothetical protein [Bacteroidales bacterium]